MSSPGGLTVAEALRRADANVAANKQRYIDVIDEKLVAAAEMTNSSQNPEDLPALRAIACEVGFLAGIYALTELKAASDLLRDLLPSSDAGLAGPPWAVIRVHVDAMVSLRRPDIGPEAAARAAVLEGLRQVNRTIAERGDE